MKTNIPLFLGFVLGLISASFASAQDTFSIVAADSTTRQVGSAGASCVDLFQIPGYKIDFLGDLLPNLGAINTQASYLAANQNNARTRMNAGDSPAQIIAWLKGNDAGFNPGIRQYGIVGFSGNGLSAAGYTGVSTMDYKNHITGNINGIYYSIQGNILSGQSILDSMEYRFRNASGDLACRLMAALQGAKKVGADTRCAPNGTSSLFAFVKVSEPTDAYNNPSFILGVKTASNAKKEPIDSLQVLFNAVKNCAVSQATSPGFEGIDLQIFPNPGSRIFYVKTGIRVTQGTCQVLNTNGVIVYAEKFTTETRLNTENWPKGMYFLRLQCLEGYVLKQFMVQ
ncbi:MAG: DUF1028 domain-containing protein [Bacteroidetes bacterium]|nr:DUF1028 domain-containing protein [Bacteroidota bacterium]